MGSTSLRNFVGVSKEPVSYTHLDVYKRQPLVGACKDRPGQRYLTAMGRLGKSTDIRHSPRAQSSPVQSEAGAEVCDVSLNSKRQV